jgi:hypothetical protein
MFPPPFNYRFKLLVDSSLLSGMATISLEIKLILRNAPASAGDEFTRTKALPACREWPGSRRTADDPEELASLHARPRGF